MSNSSLVGPLDGVVPGLDYSTVDCLERRRLLAFVNHFFVRSVESLTTFSRTVDVKLASISGRIRKLENAVTLLEAKLESVPDLAGVSSENASVSESSRAPSELEVTQRKHINHLCLVFKYERAITNQKLYSL